MTTPQRGFTLTRLLDAPRELVFQAWTDPAHLQWFFSDLGTPPEPIELDLRVGGQWRQKMVVNDDTEYFTGGIYREIVPVEKLVFTFGAFDGWPKIDPSHPEEDIVVTLLFNELGNRTEMALQVALSDELSDDRVQELLATGMQAGWGITIDRLVARFARVASQHPVA